MRQWLLILILFTIAHHGKAQVEAPDFLCISGDSLYWELPTNNCGPFNAYLIYASQDPSGPYSVLATITDPAQSVYYHQDPGVATWYYYLESDLDCPGELVLQSDTLDNEIPDMPVFQGVGVEGADVILNWTASTAPEVIGYIISRNIPGFGTVTIDTVFGGTSYTDTEAAPDLGSETYFLEALDACGNRSLISAPHETMFLEGTLPSECDRAITLTWNRYEAWSEGVAEQELWVSENGGPFEPYETISGGASQTEFMDLDNGTTYCFRILARSAGTNWEVFSSEVCLMANVIQRQNLLVATTVNVQADGSVTLDWLWNTDADLNIRRIRRGPDTGNLAILDESPEAAPLPDAPSYTDPASDANSTPVFYQVETIDACGETVSSNSLSTVHLTASAVGEAADLAWTPWVHPAATVTGYALYRVDATGGTLVSTFDAATNLAIDPTGLAETNQGQACYYVVATALLPIPGVDTITVESRSNIACATRDASVYIPNAFSPNDDGRNDTFEPYLQFGQPQSYEMHVYDRWGGQLFSTTNFSEGWDGTAAGTRLPTGYYVYFIRLVQANGNVYEAQGGVSLIR